MTARAKIPTIQGESANSGRANCNRRLRAESPLISEDRGLEWLYLPIFIHVSVLVSLHLGEAEDCVLTLSAVVMGLLPVVAAAGSRTILGGSEFLKARGQDAVQLLMLPPVGNNFVGIGAVIVTFQTVEMARTFLIGT